MLYIQHKRFLDFELVKKFVNEGIDMTQVDINNESILVYLCRISIINLDILKFLVAKKACVNQTDKNGLNILSLYLNRA